MNQFLVKIKPVAHGWRCQTYGDKHEWRYGQTVEEAIKNWHKTYGKEYGTAPLTEFEVLLPLKDLSKDNGQN